MSGSLGAVWPVQQAMYARLTADPDLMAMAQVYDEVPENAAYPHVLFGLFTEQPDDAHDRYGIDLDATLHIWSEYRGYREAAVIASHLNRLLHRQPLVVSGFTNVSVAAEYRNFLRDPDPNLRQGVMRFRVWLEQELEVP
jgi:hypothetical protein